MRGDYRPEDLVGKLFFQIGNAIIYFGVLFLKKVKSKAYILKQVVILLPSLAMLLFQSMYTTVCRLHKVADKKKIEFI